MATINSLALAILVADTGAVVTLRERMAHEGSGQRVIIAASDRNAMLAARRRVVAFLRATLPIGFSYDEHAGNRTWITPAGAHETAMYW